ncbi:MAG: DUF2911 domain-containing protein [Saprospiraceae bacterium]|nr:DUF2911 domain-containing protein [Saprospiraceae bacterium]
MKQLSTLVLLFLSIAFTNAQATLSLPAGGGNIKSGAYRQIGVTDIKISWNAPGVKGREGKIWGTPVVHYGFQNLGFGTAKESPWRAGANENTTMWFGTDVTIEGKPLAAGKYGFFVAVYPDSCTLIFSKNSSAWGSFFYNPDEDALRVTVRQKKDLPESQEWLSYSFSEQAANSAVITLNWEHWSIPFKVETDVNKLVVDKIRSELQGDKGFYYENWFAAAQFCLQKEYNLEEALAWSDNAISSFFGVENFNTYMLKSNILTKLGRTEEAETASKKAMERGSVFELHQYGRQLIAQKQPEKAMEIFALNQTRHGDTWPVHVGLMRGYSANGNIKKALEHAKIALKQAPDDLNRTNLESAVKTLSEGKAIVQ